MADCAALPNNFNQAVQKIEDRFNRLKSIPLGLHSIGLLLRFLFYVRKKRFHLEKTLQKDCLHKPENLSPKCLKLFYEIADFVRDCLIFLSQQRWPLAPQVFHGLIMHELDAWDDLAETCYIGGDPQIRELLNEVASKF